jgi:hypothetical protein
MCHYEIDLDLDLDLDPAGVQELHPTRASLIKGSQKGDWRSVQAGTPFFR